MAAKKSGPSKKEKKLQGDIDKSKKEIKELKEQIKSLKAEVKSSNQHKIELDPQSDTISINHEFQINPSLISWINDQIEKKKMKKADMHKLIHTALQIGLLAKMQGKVSQTLNMFKDEIDSELSLIQSYMETMEYKFRNVSSFKTTLEGVVADELIKHLVKTGKNDKILSTGAQSEDGTSKKGDVMSTIVQDGVSENLAIEVKFSQDYSTGYDRKVTTKGVRADPLQVIEQVFGSQSNRNAEYCIFVIDKELDPFDMNGRTIEFFPDIKGFIAVVDIEEGKFEPLKIAYELARSMTIAQQPINFDYGVLSFLLQDLELTMRRQTHIEDVGTKILEEFHAHKTAVVKSLDTTSTKMKSRFELFEGELAATKKAISEMRRLLTSFFEDGSLTPKELRQMWLKEKENSLYLTARNDAKEWMDSVNARLIEQGKKEPEKSDEAEDDAKTTDAHSAEVDYESMRVPELKELLKAAGKTVSGKKDELIARLNE